jgi:2-keto-4-pentenoate hydratase/2-oxohepta-3-ene-1,7-dioic acid hydratase in catechol pathway
MKIICIGRNYVDHAKELNNPVPTEPMVFMKPSTALLLNNEPFYYPAFSKNVHYEAEIVLRICKNGRHVQPNFASSYFDQIAIGIDFTARDLQDQCKKNGHPWEIAKAFDHSAVLSPFVPTSQVDITGVEFMMEKNDTTVQHGNTKDMIFSFETIIVYVSQFFQLNQGDLIYTGTPVGVGGIQIGDTFKGYVMVNGEKKHLMTCEIK